MSGQHFVRKVATLVLSMRALVILGFTALGFFGLPVFTARLVLFMVGMCYGLIGRPVPVGFPDGVVGGSIAVGGVVLGLALMLIYISLVRRFLRLCERLAGEQVAKRVPDIS